MVYGLEFVRYNKICNIEFLQVWIEFFSNIVQPRNMKIGLNFHFSIYFIKLF